MNYFFGTGADRRSKGSVSGAPPSGITSGSYIYTSANDGTYIRSDTSPITSPNESPRPGEGKSSSSTSRPKGDSLILGEERREAAYEYEQFEKQQKTQAKKQKTAVLSGALGAIGGFFLGGPPGAIAGAALASAGSSYTMVSQTRKNSDHTLQSSITWRRTYRDPLLVEPPNERRIKFLFKWAQLRLEEGGNEESILLMFDEVISHVEPWVARAKMPEQTKEARNMISLFGKFMDIPKVCEFFLVANSTWLAAWELNERDADDAHYRFVHILPLLVEMRNIVQPDGHERASLRESSGLVGVQTSEALDSLHEWVEETLNRASVRKFIKDHIVGLEQRPLPVSRKISSLSESEDDCGRMELPPEGAEDEMELAGESDEFFDVVEGGPMRSESMIFGEYQRSRHVPNEQHVWDESDNEWKVRSATYLQNKVKSISPPSLAVLLAVDIAHSGGKDIVEMTKQSNSAYEYIRTSGNTNFLLVVNWRCPPMHCVNVFDVAEQDASLQHFLKMSTEERNGRLKVIPHCVEGPWLARTAIGSTPVIIGKKIEIRYFDGPDFLEISINVFSSAAARRMMNLVCSTSKKMVIDVALLIEAQSTTELPERILGSFRVVRTDITRMRDLQD